MHNNIMVLGTTSNAGKSFVAAGLCRIFYQDGYRTAPFKSQNMALNSYITGDGLEMGRAQAVQAQACGKKPSVFMNPILLKPTSDRGSQVIVNGEIYRDMTAREYYQNKKALIPVIKKAYQVLADENDIVVIEGAGSPAEINLKQDDIVNLGMARMVGAPCILVADIDRGGVFASIYGTIMLLEEQERRYIKGIIINKFRGDKAILQNGLDMIASLTGVPVLGVLPYADIDLEDEDSLSRKLMKKEKSPGLDIAVIQFPRISNFTDFDALHASGQASVRYVRDISELGMPDAVILPGTKSTMHDLLWMRQNGLEAQIKKLRAGGCTILGICGGYQMLGNVLEYPQGVELGRTIPGMGLLDCVTVFKNEKIRTQIGGNVCRRTGFLKDLEKVYGYEIHMGQTFCENPWILLDDGRSDGGVSTDGHVIGTYLHGIFDKGDFLRLFLNNLLEKKGEEGSVQISSYEDYKTLQFEKLEKILRDNVDIKRIYDIIQGGSID